MFSPTPLNLPPYPFKLTERGGVIHIFDELRKKHLVLTPEEWVRQHFIQYLINDKKFPKTLLEIEGGLKLNQLQKRADLVVLSKQGEKLMVVECKAPSVKITQAVFDQAARYNSMYKARWIVVTNGLEHYYAMIDHVNAGFKFVQTLPDFALL